MLVNISSTLKAKITEHHKEQRYRSDVIVESYAIFDLFFFPAIEKHRRLFLIINYS